MSAYIAPAESVDWGTPQSEWDEVIRPILGDVVHRDPACLANSPASRIVQFANYGKTKSDDGFLKMWNNEIVFMNPPWGEKWNKKWGPVPDTFHKMSLWIAKMMAETTPTLDNPAHGLMLLPAYTDRPWFHHYVARSTAFCLLRERIRFLRADGTVGAQPGQGHMYVLRSSAPWMLERFVRVCDPRGLVIVPS